MSLRSAQKQSVPPEGTQVGLRANTRLAEVLSFGARAGKAKASNVKSEPKPEINARSLFTLRRMEDLKGLMPPIRMFKLIQEEWDELPEAEKDELKAAAARMNAADVSP